MNIVEHPLAGGNRVRPRPVFPIWLTRVNAFFAMFVFAISANAITDTFSANGMSVSWTTTGTSPYSVSGTWTQTYPANKGGGIHKNPWPGSWTVQFGNGNGSGTWSMSGLTADQPMYMVEYTDIPPTTETGRFTFTISNGTTDKYADFKIPNNLGSKSVSVKFYQNGVLKASYTATPGAGVQNVHLTNLDGVGIVTAVYGYGEYSYDASGNIVYTADKVFLPAGGAEPTNASEPPEATWLISIGSPGGRAKPSIKPAVVAVTPKTPETTVSAPTAVATPAAPAVINKHTRTVLGVPFGSPSGSSGVTKQDSEVVANAVVAALNTTDANRAGQADKQIDATNNVATALATQTNAQLSALNALRTETATGINKTVGVGNGLQSALEGLRGDVRTGNATLEAINITLGALELANTAPPEADSKDSMTTLVGVATDYMDSVAEATDVQPAVGDVATDDTDAGSGMPDVTIPGSAAGGHTAVTMSLNPLQNAEVKQLADLLRALIGWLVLFSLIAWTYMKIPEWMTQALQGGSGFTAWRAAVGAVPLVGIAIMTFLVVVGGAVILTAPTIWWAYADPLMMGSAGTALVDVREVITTYGGPNAGLMISLMDAFMPTGLIMTAAFNFITLKIGGQAICAALIAFSKVLAS